MKRCLFYVCCLAVLTSNVPFSRASAQTFNPNSLLSDAIFFDPSDMDLGEIQRFLERKGSMLASFRTLDTKGIERSAAEIIWNAAATYGINPKTLLVLLQKEQSLIEHPTPTQYSLDWATGFARCDSCSADDPGIQKYKGFSTQVDRAAWRQQYYRTHPDEFAFRPGEMRLVDGIAVTPANWATAILYNYTPHIRGNISFWKIWNRYFEKTYPDGVLVQEAGSDDIWLIQGGGRRIFTSMASFLSRYRMSQVVRVAPSSLDTYPILSPIRYGQYSLLQSPKGAVFLYMDDIKYGIPSRAVFRSIGFHPDEIIMISANELDAIPTVGLLSSKEVSPKPKLIQDSKTGGVWAVSGGKKQPILERAILATNFPYQKIVKGETEKLDRLEKTQAVLFRDGTLVQDPHTRSVYIISHGEKRPIAHEDAFHALGFEWSQVVESSGATLALHPTGELIDIGREVNDLQLVSMK